MTKGNVGLFWAWDIRCCGFWADSRRGQCLSSPPSSPACLSGLYFYSKADGPVSWCLYTISTIMGVRGAAPPCLPAWQHLSGQPVCKWNPFFPSYHWLALLSSRCFWYIQSQWCVTAFLTITLIHHTDSSTWWDIPGAFKGLYICIFAVKLVKVDWRRCVCVCSVVTGCGSGRSEELRFTRGNGRFRQRQAQPHMELYLCCRKLCKDVVSWIAMAHSNNWKRSSFYPHI